ncbi:MAG TPA: hypothetical protein VFM25_12780 [Verrucomicrobiae bacterium]|nr:hypothetical protein [Verrucomicrobiae bacterium]
MKSSLGHRLEPNLSPSVAKIEIGGRISNGKQQKTNCKKCQAYRNKTDFGKSPPKTSHSFGKSEAHAKQLACIKETHPEVSATKGDKGQTCVECRGN